jgi:hypothetical protein
VAKEPDRRGEHEVSRKTIARGMPGDSGVTVATTCTLFAAAHRRPAFPAPSDGRVEENFSKARADCAARFMGMSGGRHCEPTGRANARPITGSAKQSICSLCGDMDCFVASAPRNDGPCSPGGAKRSPRLSLRDVPDCAEPVIGRRFRPLAGHGDFLLNLARLIVIGFALKPCNIPSNLDQTRPI